MGLQRELGIEIGDPNAFQRVVQRIASSRPGAWVFQRTLHPLDRLLFRLTDGRITVPGIMAGLPVVMFTTTGAKSGALRTMPLLAVPVDDDLVVIGSNFGQANTPGWVYNLEADPAATVSYRTRSVDVRAERASSAQADQAFERAAQVYPGYSKYRERAAHRTIRVFVLRPTPA